MMMMMMMNYVGWCFCCWWISRGWHWDAWW